MDESEVVLVVSQKDDEQARKSEEDVRQEVEFYDDSSISMVAQDEFVPRKQPKCNDINGKGL